MSEDESERFLKDGDSGGEAGVDSELEIKTGLKSSLGKESVLDSLEIEIISASPRDDKLSRSMESVSLEGVDDSN